MSDDNESLPYGVLTRCGHALEEDPERQKRLDAANQRAAAWADWQPSSEAEAHAQLRALRYVMRVTQSLVVYRAQDGPISRAQRQVLEEQGLGREQVRDEIAALVRYLEEHWP